MQNAESAWRPKHDGLVDPESNYQTLTSLLDQHGSQLHSLLMQITLRADAAEELLQDLFVRLATSESFQRADDPSAYTFRSAINLAFDWRRRQSRLAVSAVMTAEEEYEPDPPIAGLIQREELDCVVDALGELSSVSREIVIYRFLQQLSYSEIAVRLGKSAHQCRAICSKALAHLRSLLIKPEP